MPPATRYVMPASFVQTLVVIPTVLLALKRRLDGPILQMKRNRFHLQFVTPRNERLHDVNSEGTVQKIQRGSYVAVLYTMPHLF